MAVKAVRDPQLNCTDRTRLIAEVRRIEPDCWLCGNPIHMDYYPSHHPLGSTIDEVQPRSKGGSALDLGNVHNAHRTCNSTRGARPVTDAVRAECRAAWARHTQPKRSGTRDW